MEKKKIGILVGSLRKGSFSRKIAAALKELAPAALELEYIEIGDLPIYNQDLDDEVIPPTAWTAFRQCLGRYDAILFVTPEYNRSVPAALKNAVDVGSRPFGHNQWDGKPCAIVSVTPGRLGAFGANHHLRQSLVFLNMPTMQQPEAYISNAGKFFDENGKLIDESIRTSLAKYMEAFEHWININTRN